MTDSNFDERTKLSTMEISEDDSTPLESLDISMVKVQEASLKQVLRRENTGRQVKLNYRKAPHIPNRFKSSYTIFFTENRERIQREIGKNANDSEIYRRALERWKYMSIEQRDVWQNKALQDKQRFDAEMSICKGFWRITFNRATKDPNSPKRPRS